METLVEGFSRTRRCTPEGRALMSLDIKVFQSGIDQISKIRPTPHIDFVEAYVKAYYLPEHELINWFKSHPVPLFVYHPNCRRYHCLKLN